MVQNILFEIILNLLKNNENHIRNMATDIGVSHVEIIRKLNKSQDIFEYKTQSRNKIYFLKNTFEAKNHTFMAEYYKTNKIMFKYPELSIIFQELLKETDSKLIVLFGSYAKEIATKNSDIDVYVETTSKVLKEKAKLISRKLNLKIGEFELGNSLAKEIILNHVIIKGVERFYDISQ